MFLTTLVNVGYSLRLHKLALFFSSLSKAGEKGALKYFLKIERAFLTLKLNN